MGWRRAIVPIRTMISSYDFRKNLLQGNLKTCIHIHLVSNYQIRYTLYYVSFSLRVRNPYSPRYWVFLFLVFLHIYYSI